MDSHDGCCGPSICGAPSTEAGSSVGPDFVAPEKCPRCGAEVETGYGLAGGGFGTYWFCWTDSCEWMAKIQECPVCEEVCPPGAQHAEETK